MIGSKPFRRIGVLIAAVALCVAIGPTSSADELGTQSAQPLVGDELKSLDITHDS